MSDLKQILCEGPNRDRVIADTVRLVESEVKSKGGVSGMAIKAGFKAVNAIKPTFIRDSVDNLLDRFVVRLAPYYDTWVEQGKAPSFERFLEERRSEVANALLAVTDERAAQVQAGTVKKAYERLRPTGEKNVEAAVPALGRMVEPYLR